MAYKYNLEELQDEYNNAGKDAKVIFKGPDASKGIDYCYVIVIPNDCLADMDNNCFVIDCLNYHEDGIEGKLENSKALKDFFKTFDLNVDCSKGKDEEDYDKTNERLVQRVGNATNVAARLSFRGFKKPTIVPMIPVYSDVKYGDSYPQELRTGVAKDIAPQIEAMFEEARECFKEFTGRDAKEKWIQFGHSSSSRFGNNMSMLYPEKIQGLMIGGIGALGLPVDEITLEVVENIDGSERVSLEPDGSLKWKVMQDELDQIKKEYEEKRQPHQRVFSKISDNVYSMPMNFPDGLDDIEYYRDLSDFPGGKEEFRKKFSRIPRLFFEGEHEERVTGGFAYESGVTHDGIEYLAGDSIKSITGQEDKFEYVDIEYGPMQTMGKMNASTDNSEIDCQYGFRPSQRILFGKEINDIFDTYVNVMKKLGIPVLKKIYPYVGHVDIYSDELFEDCMSFGTSVVNGDLPSISKGKNKILNIYQSIRHFLTSKDRTEYEQKLGELNELIGADIEEVMSPKGKNLTREQIEKINQYLTKDTQDLGKETLLAQEKVDEKDMTAVIMDSQMTETIRNSQGKK